MDNLAAVAAGNSLDNAKSVMAAWALLQLKKPTGDSTSAACYTGRCRYVSYSLENMATTLQGRKKALLASVFRGVLSFFLRCGCGNLMDDAWRMEMRMRQFGG